MILDRRAEHFILERGTTETFKKVAAFRLNVQPSTGEISVLVNGVYGQNYTIFTTYSGLNVGDLVTLSGTSTISGLLTKVTAVRNFNYPPIKHFEVVLTVPEA